MMLKILKMLKNRKGFTLVELMAVIAVIGILAAVVLPKFSGATDEAKAAQIQSDLRTIGSAVAMYYAKEGAYPGAVADLATDSKYLVKEPKPPKGVADKYPAPNKDTGEVTLKFKDYTYSSFGGEPTK